MTTPILRKFETQNYNMEVHQPVSSSLHHSAMSNNLIDTALSATEMDVDMDIDLGPLDGEDSVGLVSFRYSLSK